MAVYTELEPLPDADSRITELESRVKKDLATFAYPDREWRAIEPDNNIYDVIIIGGGQSGLICAHGLMKHQVRRILILDKHPYDDEGVWNDFARMSELLTPKMLNGIELGISSLSFQYWFFANYGEAAWDEIERVPLKDWVAYLKWYKRITAVPIHNNVDVNDVRWSGEYFDIYSHNNASSYKAKLVVMATGFDGAGKWTFPGDMQQDLPTDKVDHSNGQIDFEKYRGKRLGILGCGSSAFDAAVTALRHGAASVDLCFRRKQLPSSNPNRYVENSGLLNAYPDIDDAIRWQMAVKLRELDQPPARRSFNTACAFDNFHMHADCAWQQTRFVDEHIVVETRDTEFEFDYLIFATGLKGGLMQRPELNSMRDHIMLWKHKINTAPTDNNELAHFPYLGSHFEFIEKTPGQAPWLNRVYAFNISARVSMSLIACSISGHKFMAPRLIRGIVSRLLTDQQDQLVKNITAYDEIDLPIPENRKKELGYS